MKGPPPLHHSDPLDLQSHILIPAVVSKRIARPEDYHANLFVMIQHDFPTIRSNHEIVIDTACPAEVF